MTWIEQSAAGMVPPVSWMPALPIASGPPPFAVSVPPQVLVTVVEASVIAPGEVGNTSVKASPVSATAFGSVKLIVSVVVWPGPIEGAPNALVTIGRERTSRLALAPALEPSVVLATGGLTDFAAPNRSRIVRQVNGKNVETRVKLGNLLNDGDLSQNLELKPGDVFIVPQSLF